VSARLAAPETVVLVHNAYQQPGGECSVFEAEAALLESRGHRVVRFTAHNDAVETMSRVQVAAGTIWSRPQRARLAEVLERVRADVVHCHNTFPLISPAVYYAARAAGVPVVQTLHNYRLLCPEAKLFRDGRPCESCVGRAVPWPAVTHACYRGDRSASAAVAAMLAVHRGLGTWNTRVDAYIALTEFARGKFVAGGLPADRIRVKGHFIDPDPGPGTGRGGYALFVGRLSAEKGIETLLAAWPRVGAGLPLRIAGDGPLADHVAAAAHPGSHVQWLGARTAADVADLMGDAALLVFPSECYETFGRVVIEALARGTPVLASDGGAAAELVEDGATGFLFRAGDAGALAAGAHRALAEPDLADGFRRRARAAFLDRFSADANYERLIEIYAEVRRGGRRAGSEPRRGREEPGAHGSAAAADRTAAVRPRGRLIVVVGPDGAGKTTVARALAEAHTGETAYFHFSPPLRGPLDAMPPAAGSARADKGGAGGSRALGWARIARNFVRFWLGYMVTVRPALRRGALVIGDRWAYGYMVQPHALKFFGPRALAALAIRHLPRPDLVVNLAAPPEVVHARKQELTPAEIATELVAWAGLPEPRLRTFDARESPAALARRVLESIPV
jgi:glycosyltransferase involved in cell wall biosynthesis